jgi:APA family basic amino acid/polyamine antiporter
MSSAHGATASAGPSLVRRVGLWGAVFIGLGSMIGAGVFSAFAPAASVAGNWLLLGLALAGGVAYANATASAQLAAQFPTSGGTYAYGREMLGPWWGFVAGWSFVVGKIASAAAIALTFAAYTVPAPWQKPLAILAVVVLLAVNLRGITRTAQMAMVLVLPVILILGVVLAAAFSAPGMGNDSPLAPSAGSPYGVLQSAGLLFFAFAGYARIATLGEEVLNPRRTIPRAIVLALGIAFVLYAAVAVALVHALSPGGVATSSQPALDAVRASGWEWALPLVAVGASLATLGSLLGLIAGIGRTSFAMAREGDLPRGLAAVHPRFHVPYRAELAVGLVVIALVALTDVRQAIGFSSFGVLLYYFIANLSAWRQAPGHRRYPRWLQAVGAASCLLLCVTLPLTSVLVGAGVVALGVLGRLIARAWSRARMRSTEA